jgi:hypothetical protein
MYRELCKREVPHAHCDSDVMDSSGLEAFRDKLRQQCDVLEEYINAFSQGRYRIYLDFRGLEDIYVQAFSGDCREWHLDAILKDLELMLAELQKWPLHQPMMVHKPTPVLHEGKGSQEEGQAQPSFGSLGHLGYKPVPNNSMSLQSIFYKVSRILRQRMERSEEHDRLRKHLQALVEHPDMADLLPLPPSRIP